MKKLIVIGSSVFLLAMGYSVPDKSTIRLHVIDSSTKQPISKASVTFDKNFMGLTTADGGFLIYSQIVNSKHYLVVYKTGYKAYSNSNFVIDQKNVKIDILLGK